ncbi:MAG: hypothetical protein PVJ09_02685 [Candidatus Woesebacteria bacterium]|jgi:hypothetical protein
MINVVGTSPIPTSSQTPAGQAAPQTTPQAAAPTPPPAAAQKAGGAGVTPPPSAKPPGNKSAMSPQLQNLFKQKKLSPKMIIAILLLVLLVVGVIVGFILSQQKQEIRQKAAVGDYCLTDAQCNVAGGEYCAPNHYCAIRPTGGGCPNNDHTATRWIRFTCPDGCTITHEPGDPPEGRYRCYSNREDFTTPVSLNGECGQVDVLDENGDFCGWTEYNCDGPCAGDGEGGTPVPGAATSTPAPTGVGGVEPTPISYSCNSSCTNTSQCQGVNPNYRCYTRAEGEPNWNLAESWNSFSISEMPSACTSVTASGAYYTPTEFRQSVWCNGGTVYFRTVPLGSNGEPNYGSAGSWNTSSISAEGLPSSCTSITAYDAYSTPTELRQALWCGTTVYFRTVPLNSSGEPNFSNVGSWNSSSISAEGLPSSCTTITGYGAYMTDSNLRQSLLCNGNVSYYHDVPLNSSGEPNFSNVGSWNSMSLSEFGLASSCTTISAYATSNNGNTLRQVFWCNGTNGYFRAVGIGSRCRLESNPSSMTCSVATAAAPTATPEPGVCGSSGCSLDNPCSGQLVCITANDGNNYCSEADQSVRDACAINPNTTTCCTAPTSAVATATPTDTVVNTTIDCNDACVQNSDCSNVSHICWNGQCRLSENPSDELCRLPGGGTTTTVTYETIQQRQIQPTLPSQLPSSGPADWLKYLKAGLGVLGFGLLLFLLL